MDARILIVDDDEGDRDVLEALLQPDNYELVFAANGREALERTAELDPDLVLLDVLLPDLSGFEVCRRLRDDPDHDQVPVIMVTALDDRESRLEGIECGADEFLSKPFDATELRARVRTTMRLNRFRRLLEERRKFERLVEIASDGILLTDADGFIRFANPAMAELVGCAGPSELVDRKVLDLIAQDHVDACIACMRIVLDEDTPVKRLETEFVRQDGSSFPVESSASLFVWNGQPGVEILVRDISERRRAEQELRTAHRELTDAYDATLEAWIRLLDLRDEETEGHTRRVTMLTLRLARTMGAAEDEMIHLRRGAILHDVGKMGIPDAILHKPGPLTDEEWAEMRRHPVYARDFLSPIEYLRPALHIPHHHHEWFDGSGYPEGLRGDEIPFPARMFAVIDVWDALRSDRPYRKAWSTEKSLEHIRSRSGIHFDPRVVEAFLAMLDGL